MAKLLSSMLLKGLTSPSASRSSRFATGWVHPTGRYSSTVPSDPDTHEDFHPSNKTGNAKASLKDIVEQDVRDNPVMLYMKGVPDYPQCGFSALAIRVLRQYEVPLSARNIIENPELKEAVKSFSNWPTFPQVFIKGEFIGGSDIVLNLHQNGELKEMLKDIAANDKAE
ncbi:unnamed protein product [Linum trigynum]|uniref:Glutaredoxin domain-containing protein n=1 Tax=Linum trigynum TaxID=586398 RepID=A0AAV2GNX8_9ROSI